MLRAGVWLLTYVICGCGVMADASPHSYHITVAQLAPCRNDPVPCPITVVLELLYAFAYRIYRTPAPSMRAVFACYLLISSVSLLQHAGRRRLD